MTYQNTIANHLREWVAIIRVPGRSSLLMADELLDAADLLDAQAAEIAALKDQLAELTAAILAWRDGLEVESDVEARTLWVCLRESDRLRALADRLRAKAKP